MKIRHDKLATRRARVMTILYRDGLFATFALLKFSPLKREAVSTALLAVVLLFVGRGVTAAQTGSGEKLKVAFFGFELVNTSLQPTTDAEKQRLIVVGYTLTQMLAGSGRYEVV